MRKKTGLLLLGIALVGALIYFLPSGIPPEQQPVEPTKLVPPSPGGQAEPVKPRPVEQPSFDPVSVETHAGQGTVDAAVAPAPQQVPALDPEIRAALGELLNTSSEGLVEETRNGVTSIDLQGRFRTAPVATIDKDGNVQITDYSYLPVKAPAKP